MRGLFWVGLVIFLLGIASLFVPVPHNENHGIQAGGVSIGVQTHENERVPPYVSAILLAGGIGMMLAGGRK